MSKTMVVSTTFMESYADLPNKDQKRVSEFVNKFNNNPNSPGINYEKIIGALDNKLRSVRINDDYRGIIAQYPDTYLLLYVDHHDKAYNWAKNRRCEINQQTNCVQLYVASISDEIVPSPKTEARLFSNISERKLLSLGVPEIQLNLIKSLETFDDFIKIKDTIPAEVYEYLSYVATGTGTIDEVLQLISDERVESQTVATQTLKDKVIPGQDETQISDHISDTDTDIKTALSTPISRMNFHIVESETDLIRIMSEPLEKWRTFLHPTQRKIISKNYTGPVRILGGAGTGKTVVAIHRARWLAQNRDFTGQILFTTFTANLAADIKEHLRKICTSDELKRIDVVNIDALVVRFLRQEGYPFSIIYDDKLNKIWERAIDASENVSFDNLFYQDEYSKVVTFNNAFTKKDYLLAPRVGRGTRLDRNKREEVWSVFEEYRKILQEEKVRDIETALYECLQISDKHQNDPYYSSIVVDEAQDLSMNAFRFLRSLAGPEHNNDIFIVGDTHQRIYKHKVVLGKSGINIVGRSSILRLNYRTTEETRKFAYAILKGISFDDMDAGIDTGVSQSLTHSVPPVVKNFKNVKKEAQYITSEIQDIVKNGTDLKNICLVARTNTCLADYKKFFKEENIPYYEVKRKLPDDLKFDGVRVATMHRVKGLEFDYIFVAAANNGLIPLKLAINQTDKVTAEETLKAEKCLLYVALTRARRKAYITSYGKQSDIIPTNI
ncbi:MAG: UvrD-helicase domain-containing protein [Endomicrobium sp.]|jgi:mRNA-degrading endonuclease RelE of RelBE toxin-antitoxin system|nr:UvrD-helicase domain-containing protein [Endomicrobium sp.]